ncbi:MAG: DUF664 domain-containing protein [Caldilineae bacterium]|nr:MAG: DUF664 domain-containing protein [Caldilineae bacterium]
MHPEIYHYLHMIEDLRHQVREIIQDLPAEALNWRPLPASDDHAMNSLAVMVAHILGAEHFWIAEVIDGRPPTRDRDREFRTRVDGPQPLLEQLDRVAAETRAILTTLPAERLDETRQVQGRSVSVRWGILHVIDHTALHLGHMQITYQLWAHGESKPMPRWFQRTP